MTGREVVYESDLVAILYCHLRMPEKAMSDGERAPLFQRKLAVHASDGTDRGFAPGGQVAKLRGLRKLNLKEDSTDAHFRFDRMLAREITSRNN